MMLSSACQSVLKLVAIGPFGGRLGYVAYAIGEGRLARRALPEGWHWRRCPLDRWELLQSGGSAIVARVLERGFGVVKTR